MGRSLALFWRAPQFELCAGFAIANWMHLGPSFSGTAEAAMAVAEHRDTLDPDGSLERFSLQPTVNEEA